MQDRAKEANVKSVAHTTQLAAEDWAVRNNGIYTGNVADVITLLPGGNLLTNAFTGNDTEPVAGAATSAGQVGYVVINDGASNVGYTITGFGKDANQGDAGIIIELTSGS